MPRARNLQKGQQVAPGLKHLESVTRSYLLAHPNHPLGWERIIEDVPGYPNRLGGQNPVQAPQGGVQPGPNVQPGVQVSPPGRGQPAAPRPGTRERFFYDAVGKFPIQPGESNEHYVERINNELRNYPHKYPGWEQLSADQRRPFTVDEVGLGQPRPQGATTSEAVTANGNPISGNNPTTGTPSRQNQVTSGMNDDLERMNALLGQIKRTGRRATPNELNQIRDIYNNVNDAVISGGGVPQQLQDPLNRIRKDFNQQAHLLHVNGLVTAGTNAATEQARINQQLTQQGRLPDIPMTGNRINYEPLVQQFRQFFVKNAQGGIARGGGGTGDPQIIPQENVSENDLPMYLKLRSDVNHVLRANNDQNLQGLQHPQATQRVDEAGWLQQDAQYRQSPQYQQTQIPHSGPLWESVKTNYYKPEGQIQPETQRSSQAAPTQAAQPGTTQHRDIGQTIAGMLDLAYFQPGTFSSLYNAMRRKKGQPEVNFPQQQPIPQGQTRPTPATNDPIYERAKELSETLFGGGYDIEQIPTMTREQLNLLEELTPLAQQSLQRASQPINYLPQRQQEANTSVGNILQRIQSGDFAGAQQELTRAGGAANVTALANLPGLAALQAPSNLTPQQRTQFGQLFNNQPIPQQQPTSTIIGTNNPSRVTLSQPHLGGGGPANQQQVNQALGRMNQIAREHNARQGMERAPYSPQDQAEFNQLYTLVSSAAPTSPQLQQLVNAYNADNPNARLGAQPQAAPQPQAQPQAQPQERQLRPDVRRYYIKTSEGNLIPAYFDDQGHPVPEDQAYIQPPVQQRQQPQPQTVQPQAVPQPQVQQQNFQPQQFGGVPFQQSGSGFLSKVRQGLNQADLGIQGAQQVQQGAQKVGQTASGFIPQVKQAYAQRGFFPALDLAIRKGQEGFEGLSKIAQGTRQTVGATGALFGGQPPIQGGPGGPGGGGGGPGGPGGGYPYPVPGLGQGTAYGYPHPLPATATGEINRFYQQTIPSLAERFTAMGGGQRSSAFQNALGTAGVNLGQGLQALSEQNVPNQLYAQQQAYNQASAERAYNTQQQQYQNEQQQFEREYNRIHGLGMLPYLLQQRSQPTVIPGQPGILPAMANLAGTVAGSAAGAYFGRP